MLLSAPNVIIYLPYINGCLPNEANIEKKENFLSILSREKRRDYEFTFMGTGGGMEIAKISIC